MTRTKLRLAALAAALVLGAGLAACSDDDDSSTETTSEAAAGVPSEENETWCTSVENLLEQAGTDELSVSASLPELSQAFTSLAANAPAEVADDVQTLATISSAALELSQSSPGSTLPEATRQEAVDAWDDMDAWVTENCGIEVPELTP